MNIKEIIGNLGGETTVAYKCGVHQVTVCYWIRVNTIPLQYWAKLIEVSAGKLKIETIYKACIKNQNKK